MSDSLNTTAIAVFIAFFILVTVIGFFAARWKAGDMTQLHEWGLGGRQFGTLITWFLVGGDFYTAYTVIAVPAAVYGAGASGFFALPYTIIVYPFVFLVMPKLWRICHKENYITSADFVQGVYGGKWFAAAIAVTGIVATMPYIALQLVGMQAVIKGLGIDGEIPLLIAFVILALYTYASGIRAPAMIAFVKDIMIYIVVIAAVCLIPSKVGGYSSVFDAADGFFKAKVAAGGAGGILLKPVQFTGYASLALGSALAAFMYPHTMTAILSSASEKTIRKNAILLPAYTVLLGLIALMGYMAISAGVSVKNTSDVVPQLFAKLFPDWFIGFAAAAIAISALVPAAIMSIGAANLFTRNLWKPLVNANITPAQESANAKIVSLLVKFGALVFIFVLPTKFAIELQLLGGMWILQTFPAIVFTLFTRKLKAPGLFIGWAAGMICGTTMAFMVDLKPLYTVAGTPLYIGLIALAINIVVTLVASTVVPAGKPARVSA